MTTTYGPGEVAERTGVSVDTLRYYEREGLLSDVTRSAGGRRTYTVEHLGWLDVLCCLRRTGMPIRDIRAFVELGQVGDDRRRRREALQRHRERVVEQVAELERALTVIDGKIEAYR